MFLQIVLFSLFLVILDRFIIRVFNLGWVFFFGGGGGGYGVVMIRWMLW